MKKLGFGILWFLALSIGTLMLGGMVAAAIEGANDPAAGEAAGQAFGERYGGIIFLVSFIVATAGSILGWLPGTKTRNA